MEYQGRQGHALSIKCESTKILGHLLNNTQVIILAKYLSLINEKTEVNNHNISN